jgi:rhodanese-related sulfurtransferase
VQPYARPSVPSVAASALPPDALLLDVREDDEWVAGHIEGARHVPMNEVPQHVQFGELDPSDGPVVVICRSGARSGQVTAWLRQLGFDARNLDGGMVDWAERGRPMVSEQGSEPRIA